MTNSRLVLWASIALMAIASGCNGGITNPMQQLNAGALSVDFPDGTELLTQNGTYFKQDASRFIVSSTADVSGAHIGEEITLTIPIQNAVPYSVVAPPDDFSDVGYFDNTSHQYDGNMAQGSCVITITQTSPTLIGTFSARAVCTSTDDSVRILSQGAFNANPQ